MWGRLIWNVLLLVAGLAYVLLVLADYSPSPLFVILFVSLAAQEMIHSHRNKH